MKSSLTTLFDVSAIGLSALCLVHCLLLPVVAALLPVLAAAGEAEWMHLLFVVLAVPLATAALWRAHGLRPLPGPLLALAGTGITGLLAGALGWPSEALETPLTVAGGVLLASAHVWNWRRRPHPACGG